MASGLGGYSARVTGRLALLIWRVGDRLFRAGDACARQHSWQIMARHRRLARTYRDPRFDRFRRCVVCGGTGIGPDDQACGHCSGTGRITFAPMPPADRGRAR
jgi:hypothetical protein